jgi:DNA-binding beta-propeller fold protein YncE
MDRRSSWFMLMPAIGGVVGVVLNLVPATSREAAAQVAPYETVGRQPDGTVAVSTNQVLTPAGRQAEFRGRPNTLTLSPDRKTAAILSAGYKAITLIDVETGTVKQEFDAAGASASFGGILYAKDGRTLYASQADGNLIIANVDGNGTLTLGQKVKLPPGSIRYPGASLNPYPGGLALSADGKMLYICLNRNNTIGVFDLSSRTLVKEIAVGNAPTDIVLAGDKAYVSNRGGRPAEDGDFTVDSSGTPIVANKESAYAATGTVSVVDLITGSEERTIEVGLQPSALLLDDGRLFVANTNSDTVSIVDITRGRVVKTIAIRPFPGVLVGSSPNALAMIDNERLVVSLGRNNAVAVYSLKDLQRNFSGAVQFLGLIPTGWYPAGLAVDPEAHRLIVANTKGVGPLGPDVSTGLPSGPEVKKGKSVFAYIGSLSLIDFPPDGEVTSYTAQVLKNNNWSRLAQRMEVMSGPVNAKLPVPVPEQLGDPSIFKHVFYIIKENRTYDQVFGDLSPGNGDPGLVQFGRAVTPNQHALAEQFVLFDNLYVAGTNSADGHQWITQSFVVDYIEKSYGGFVRTYPFNAGDSLAYPQTGFLWENALKFGKSVRVYGEYVSNLYADGVKMGPWLDKPGKQVGGGETEAGGWAAFYEDAQILGGKLPGKPHVRLEARSDIPSLDRIISRDYPPYHQAITDQYRVEVFLREFNEYVKNGDLPNLVIIGLTSDHSEGNTPGYPVPAAMVADNDLAVGRIVEAISHSPYWKDSVIIVIEDDAQFGVDHVSGNRTTGLVISPYTKRNVVDSRYYTQLDINRTIEQVLGLPPMTQMDMASDPLSMKDVFTSVPDFTPYTVLSNQIALDTMNPRLGSLNGLEKAWALAMYQQDFSKIDAADPHLLNRVIWYSTKGFDRPYPGDDRVLQPDEVHPYLKAQGQRDDAGDDDDN